MEVSKEFKFSASHVLPKHPSLCSNLHGHNWTLFVFVRGPIDPETGMVIDYADIKNAVEPIIRELDHTHLGAWQTDKVEIELPNYDNQTLHKRNWLEGDGSDRFNPTSENLLVAIAKRLVQKGFVFSRLQLKETDTVNCELSWEEFSHYAR